MDYGIRKVLKEKELSSGKIQMCKMGGSIYAVLVYNKRGALIDSVCNICDGKSSKAMLLELNKEYQIRLDKLMKGEDF